MSDDDKQASKDQQDTSAADDKSREADQNKKPEAKPADKKTELTPEQWEYVYGSDRFKQLNEKAKTAEAKLAEIAEKEQAERDEQLAKKGEFETLLKQKDDQIENLKSQHTTQRKREAIISAAVKQGAIDPEVLTALIDMNSLEVDKDGIVQNAEDVVKSLVETKPYLIGKKSAAPNMGSGGSPSAGEPGRVYTTKEIQEIGKNKQLWDEHKDDIAAAQKEGRIKED